MGYPSALRVHRHRAPNFCCRLTTIAKFWHSLFLVVTPLTVWQSGVITIQRLPNLEGTVDKDPRKEARRVFRQYGGTVDTFHKHVTEWQFPDGFRMRLGDDDHHGTVAAKLRTIHERYGQQPSKELRGLRKVGNAPRIDLERLTASEHAKDRLALMQSQRTVTFQQVLHTLRLPEKTLYSARHESWVWIREPLAVAVCEVPDGFLIKTVLWSDNDLFDLHPRPTSSANVREVQQ